MAELQPGTYQLTRDVENPKPDRRSRSDWRLQAVLEKGTRFVATREVYGSVEVTALRRFGSYRDATPHFCEEVFNAIVPYLERVADKPTDLLARRGYVDGMRGLVLDRLFATGKITLADVESALNEIEAEE